MAISTKVSAVPLGLTPGRVSRHQLSLEVYVHVSLIAKELKTSVTVSPRWLENTRVPTGDSAR